MNINTLIVHPEKYMIEEIRSVLKGIEKKTRHEFTIEDATTQRTAEEHAPVDKPLNLVITALEIPKGEGLSEGAGEQGRRGKALILTLRDRYPKVAAILITRLFDADLRKFTESKKVPWVLEGSDIKEELEEKIMGFLLPPKKELNRHVDLEITLSQKNGCFYQFQLEGEPPEEPCKLDVEYSTLDKLVKRSSIVNRRIDKVGLTEDWEFDLRTLGDELGRELFYSTASNEKFRDTFFYWQGVAGGPKRMRVRFKVEDTLHPIAVEALKAREDRDYLMLETPVYRRQEAYQPPYSDGSRKVRTLFPEAQNESETINFLIIQAEFDDTSVKDEKEQLDIPNLPKLPNLKIEVAKLKELLSDAKKKGMPIGEVTVLDPEKVPAGKFEDEVWKVLKERPWHVIHYLGHSFLNPVTNAGYLFFPGSGIKPAIPIRIDRFARHLAEGDTRFIFLSSCKGAEQDFIHHLAKQGIPAIMGFRWKVNDAAATQYVERFYRRLLEGEEHSLELACLEAKNDMKLEDARDPVWAAALLVKQVGA